MDRDEPGKYCVQRGVRSVLRGTDSSFPGWSGMSTSIGDGNGNGYELSAVETTRNELKTEYDPHQSGNGLVIQTLTMWSRRSSRIGSLTGIDLTWFSTFLKATPSPRIKNDGKTT